MSLCGNFGRVFHRPVVDLLPAASLHFREVQIVLDLHNKTLHTVLFLSEGRMQNDSICSNTSRRARRQMLHILKS